MWNLCTCSSPAEAAALTTACFVVQAAGEGSSAEAAGGAAPMATDASGSGNAPAAGGGAPAAGAGAGGGQAQAPATGGAAAGGGAVASGGADAAVAQLMQLGFTQDACVRALGAAGGNAEVAASLLFSGMD